MFSFQLLERDMHNCTLIAAFQLITVCGYIVYCILILSRKADEYAAHLMEAELEGLRRKRQNLSGLSQTRLVVRSIYPRGGYYSPEVRFAFSHIAKKAKFCAS